MSSASIECHQGIDTSLNADSVEWCPVNNLTQYLLCGTYQLNESSDAKSQTRNGCLHLYKLEENTTKLTLEDKLETAGVLDIKWAPKEVSKTPNLAFVNAEGYVQFFTICESENEKTKIISTGSCRVEEDGLGLALDWSRLENNQLVASTSLGNLVVIDSNGEIKYKWKAHEYEAWTCAYDQNETNLIYSGGDDCKFKVWDLRMEPVEPVRVIRKEHGVGVTTISVNSLNPSCICTGSYDEFLREWDTRFFQKPIQKLCVGGGVWRIKFNPLGSNHVAVAAMRNGVHILSLNDSTDHSAFMAHESMVYGVDWNYEYKDEGNHLLASCSFYDHSLKLWSWKKEKTK